MATVTITKENFDSKVLAAAEPVLLDFWAPWCGPCRMVSPIVDEIAEQTDGVRIGKVNIDEQPELAERFGIMSVPTLLVLRNGEPVEKAVGARPKQAILKMLGR